MSDEKLERDKLLLELMTHVYDEEVARNELVDSKNSQMIILTGAMLTLQATLISKLLIDNVLLNTKLSVACFWEVILSVLMVSSIGCYFISMYLFIEAYTFKNNYQIAPEQESVINTLNEDCSKSDIVEDMIYVYDEAMSTNGDIIDKKVNIGSKGFLFLKIAGFLTLLFIFLFILFLFSYYVIL